MSVKAQKDPEKLSYEEAMSELESLVGRMEQGGLTLEESVHLKSRLKAMPAALRSRRRAVPSLTALRNGSGSWMKRESSPL